MEYSRWYYIRDIKAFYDFYLLKHNLLIEVDGDFWYCNPNGKHSEAKYASQIKNLKKDKIKTDWCEENNIKLLRFWETDINTKPEEVINILKEELKNHK